MKAYLSIIDQEKVKQPLSETDSLCAIIDGEEEEESSKSEEDEEDDRLQTMQDARKPWHEICFYFLKQIALISTSIHQVKSPSNAHPGLNRLLKSSSVTVIEPGHHDTRMEPWEDTVDHLLKDIHDAERNLLKDNIRKIVCRTNSNLVFTNDKKRDSLKPNFTETLKFTGAYHCELVPMALLLRVCINSLALLNFMAFKVNHTLGQI